jgi:hypothetical protein
VRRLRTAAQIAANRPGGRLALGYASVDDNTKRRATTSRTSHEGFILTPQKRERASATARDDRRSFTILAWMIRRHLDNVSRFTPHFRAKDKELTRVVNKLLYWHGRRNQFDVLGQHGRDEWMRMFEACKVISGDAGGLKCKGGKLQGIEGDRIAKPSDIPANAPKELKAVTENGLLIDPVTGFRSGFCLCKRGDRGSTMEFERIVAASELVYDGYWPDRFDADRGVSPLLTALNESADVQETREWMIQKVKNSGIFGLKFTRTGSDEMPGIMGNEPLPAAPTTETASYVAQVAASVRARSMINLDMDPGDDVSEVESATPYPPAVELTRELIRSVLLALDVPFTFYDSMTASFSARIADRNEYEEACEWKRDKNVCVLSDIYDWLLPMWDRVDLFGLSKALKDAKMSVEELCASLRWMPNGRAWLDRTNEMSGNILSLAAGMSSIPRLCASYGEDAYEIAEEQKEYLETCGIPILYAQGGQVAVQNVLNATGQQPAKGTSDGNQVPQK